MKTGRLAVANSAAFSLSATIAKRGVLATGRAFAAEIRSMASAARLAKPSAAMAQHKVLLDFILALSSKLNGYPRAARSQRMPVGV